MKGVQKGALVQVKDALLHRCTLGPQIRIKIRSYVRYVIPVESIRIRSTYTYNTYVRVGKYVKKIRNVNYVAQHYIAVVVASVPPDVLFALGGRNSGKISRCRDAAIIFWVTFRIPGSRRRAG